MPVRNVMLKGISAVSVLFPFPVRGLLLIQSVPAELRPSRHVAKIN
jgi:hypothetical protein